MRGLPRITADSRVLPRIAVLGGRASRPPFRGEQACKRKPHALDAGFILLTPITAHSRPAAPAVAQTSPPSPSASARSRRSEAETDKSASRAPLKQSRKSAAPAGLET